MTSVTDRVRAFYRANPYPSYGEAIKQRHIAWYKKHCARPGRYLEAGCGTGHVMTGIAVNLPQHDYHAIDLSDASIAVAREVTQANGVEVQFQQHNLMEPLPFDFCFDYINCIGVIHHCESPERGLRHLSDKLCEDGVLFLHAYGEDYHRRRFQIVEMLDILQGDKQDTEERFALFEDYCAHHRRLERGGILKRLYRLSARDLLLPLIKALGARRRQGHADDVHTWYDELEQPALTSRWLDQFANPNDRAYNLRDFCALLDSAGLEPIDMISVGRDRPEHVPPTWRAAVERLSGVERYRIMELLNPSPTSPTVVARKKKTST